MALLNSLYGPGKYPAFYMSHGNYKNFYANLVQGLGGMPPTNYDLTRVQLARKPEMAAATSYQLRIPSPGQRKPSSPRATSTGVVESEKHSAETVDKNLIKPSQNPLTNFSIEGILGRKETVTSSESEDAYDDDEEENEGITDKDDGIHNISRDSNVESESVNLDRQNSLEKDNIDETEFSWLQCTRYKPPKLPRSRKREGVKKRKLGRNPRVPFTQQQVGILEQKFRQTHYLSSVDVLELSTALNLTETRVKIWFQNRRARERRDRECKKTNPHVRPPQNASSAAGSSLSPYHGAIPWPLPLPPNPTTLAQFSQALQYGPHSAFSPVPFIYTSQPHLAASPFTFYRVPEAKE